MSEKYLKEIKAVLFGVSVADAVGVPYEFKSREEVRRNPATDMRGFGTYNQPAGTWSDDSSMTFCLAEALTQEFSLRTLSNNFIEWMDNTYWTPHGEVFDVGISTGKAIAKLRLGSDPELAGGTEASENGNGSLMRILPLLFYIKDKPIDGRWLWTKKVSSVTHAHIRSVIGCFYYLEFARQILEGKGKREIYIVLQQELPEFFNRISLNDKEVAFYNRLLKADISKLPDEEIESSGYVLHTLEAAIWCLLTTNNYRDCVLKAVNLGSDTDTTASVAGGLAALLYGFDSIPKEWIRHLAKHIEITDLAERMAGYLNEDKL